MRLIYLSHTLSESTPLYNNSGSIKIIRERSIKNGDSSNNSILRTPTHAGTHIDAPYHFDENGKKLDNFNADYWFTINPSIIDLNIEPGNLITTQKIKKELEKIPPDCDILLIRTGAELWRNSSRNDYTKKGVGIDLEVAKWIRENLNLKFLGLDFISLSSPLHREIGHLAHKALLSRNESKKEPVLIIEDMKLNHLKQIPKEIIIIPLLFEESDGSMVTIIGKI